MACNNYYASTSFLARLDEIEVLQSFAGVGSLELFCEFIISNASGVDDRVRRQDVL